MRYDYECQSPDCLFLFEVEQKVTDKKRFKKCPVCNKFKLERVILEAPLGFVVDSDTEVDTVGQLAERNSKRMGKEAVLLQEAKIKQDHKRDLHRKREELKKKLPAGAKLPDIDQSKRPWYGKLSTKMDKSVNKATVTKSEKREQSKNIHHYIMTGEEK